MKVFCITYCQEEKLLYGSTLSFASIRTGFPNAEIVVIDNGSLPSVRAELRKRTAEVGGTYQQVDQEMGYSMILNGVVNIELGHIVFVDPDMVFWSNCEGFQFDALMAGRYTPKYADAANLICMPRLHTSFMWIPDARRLCRVIQNTVFYNRGFHEPVTVRNDAGEWIHYDTGATLFSGMKEHFANFTEAELDCYDHIYAGSYIDDALKQVTADSRKLLADTHEWARTDVSKLKGIWREQEAYFQSRLV